MDFGLIGEKLGHSFSKDIHGRLGGYAYELRELPRDTVEEFIRAKEFRGINVTIPYKEVVIPLLDEVSERALAIGAVNTIVYDGGKLCGDNTDFGGMQALMKHYGIEVAGRDVLVLGSGGTSKTATAVAKALGAASVNRVSRTKRDNCITYEEAYETHAVADVIINTTPVGMFPNNGACPIDIGHFPKLTGVVDAIYNPLRTRLVSEARKRGIPAAGGLYMLVAQAVLAAAKFAKVMTPAERAGLSLDTDEAVTEATERIFREVLREKQSIVLTGMPGVGKTTVGRILAERLGCEFVDSDDAIVEKCCCDIPTIFAERGEPFFRETEAEVIRELSAQGGRVIATGGGAVLRSDNVEALRSNGRVYFLDRDPALITATDGRPLSSNREALMQRYNERYPVYCSTCDVRIACEGTAEDAASQILADRERD
ncbi:MAG: AAA family ATPase [Lachnospiraceae bacterium]|nr:AAA family ATPase [Lachnospiraceae bacterium]